MTIGNAVPGWNTLSALMKFTPEGGLAIKVINKTGATSVKGKILEVYDSLDNAFELAGINDPDPSAVIYNDGIDDGELMWVVVSGKAQVLYGTTVGLGTISRAPITSDSVAAGLAVNEALPAPPFASDKHFMEIGHPIEAIGAPGLALTVLHFN